MIDPKTLGWLAGIIEGEGSIDVPNRLGKSLKVAVGMNDRDVIERVAQIFGSPVCGPYEKKWSTTAQGSRAAGILMTIFSMMGERRKKRIKLGLSLWKKRPIANKDKTQCPRGHAYDEINTYLYEKTGQRFCRTCHELD